MINKFRALNQCVKCTDNLSNMQIFASELQMFLHIIEAWC